jgi:hypothetical protein
MPAILVEEPLARCVETGAAMRRAVLVFLLLSVTTGCMSRRTKYGIAGGTVAAGAYLIAIAPAKETCSTTPDPDDPLGIGSAGCEAGNAIRASFLTIGIAAVIAGVLSFGMIARSPSPSPGPEAHEVADKIITRLAAQAILAARSGDCTTARRLVDRISRSRGELVFDDPAIAGCLR